MTHDPVSTSETKSGAPSVPLAEAVVELLRLNKVYIDTARLLVGLPVVDRVLPETYLERSLKRIGYYATWSSKAQISSLEFPCCVALSSGEYVVIVSRRDDILHVLDPQHPSTYRMVSVNEFSLEYAGRWFRLSPTLDQLVDRYAHQRTSGHWFWSRIFLEKFRVFDIVVSSLLANILAVVTSLFALQVYDRVIPGQSEATLWVLALGVGGAIAFEALLRLARARLIDQMGKDAEVEISQELFQRVIDMKMDKRPAEPAAIVHMVREFSAVKEFFTLASVGVVADLPFVFIFLVVIYGIAGNIMFIIVAGAILIVIPSILMQKRMARLSREMLGGMSSASRVLTEATYGLETIKASRSEPYFQKQWEEIVNLNAEKTTDQRSLGAFQTYWATSIQQITYVSALIAGVYMVFAGEITVGAIIAISILSTRTLSPITQLSQILFRWQNMKVALDGLTQIMDSQQERDPNRSYFRRSRLKGAIRLRGTKFAHPGTQSLAVAIEDFSLDPGTRLALLGHNGSGKSTLLRIIAGLYEPTEGEVLVDGVDIRQIDPEDLRRNIGYLPQETRLFRGSLRENLIASGGMADDDAMMQALGFGGLQEFVQRHPEGLDLQITDGGDGLSIGQRQSVGLARLYLQDPAIVLLDEPTAALDQALERELVPKIGEWLDKRTAIIATHRPQILSQVSRIALLRNGQIAAEGERDAILKSLAQKSKEQAANHSEPQ